MGVYIYTDEFIREPGEDTVAYYKFDGDLNDSSGNNHNLTWWTFTYWTLQTGAKYIQTASWQYTDAYTWIPFNSSNYTINIWVLVENVTGSRENCVVDFHTNQSDFPRVIFPNVSTARLTTNASNISITSWERHNYCIVMSNNNTATWYVDGVQKTTKTISSFNGNVPYFRINTVWKVYWNIFSEFSWVNKLSELILESKGRTNDEITSYFNQTKSNYWVN